MTTFDTLARTSATAVHRAVADLPVPAAPAAAPISLARTALYAGAGAVAAVAVIVALVVLTPDGPVDVTTETTAPDVPTTLSPTITAPDVQPPPTSVPDARAPAVPGPNDGSPGATDPASPTQPPTLIVTTPADGEHLDRAVVTFTGTTDPGATVVASGKFAADVAADGSWSIDLVLAEGANGVVFVASDDTDLTSEVRMTVYLDADDPAATPGDGTDGTTKPPDAPKPTTTTKPAAWTFTASQAYGSCSEPLPYDVFAGTAEPGTTVTITSAYGSGSATVGDGGEWRTRVDFPTAPTGVTFPVKVTDRFGAKAVFDFVSLYDG